MACVKLVQEYVPYHSGEQIRIAFLFRDGTIWPSLDSVYRSMLDDFRFDVTLIHVKDGVFPGGHTEGAEHFLTNSGLVYIPYDEVNWDTYKPHAVFVQSAFDTLWNVPSKLSIHFQRRGMRVIYVPYGIEITDTDEARKNHFQRFVLENSWRIYASSEGIKKEYMKYCRNRNAVRVCGSPKFDGVFAKEHLPIAPIIKETINDRKLVVWKMHFPKMIMQDGREHWVTPYLEEYIRFAKEMEKYSSCFFVVLPHPIMYHEIVSAQLRTHSEIIRQVKLLFEILHQKNNVYIDAEDDYRNSLYNAEAIVMDRSGVMIEAAMTGVPVLFMENSDYQEVFSPSVAKVEETFYQGTNADDMCEFIEMVMEGQDLRKEERRRILGEEFPFMDGKCGWRIKEDVYRGITAEMRPKKPQVILYGAGMICGYYLEKENWKNKDGFDVVGVADSSSAKWNKDYYGFKIISPKDMRLMDFDGIIIMTEANYFEIKKSLVYDFYFDERKIWRLDEFVWYLSHAT